MDYYLLQVVACSAMNSEMGTLGGEMKEMQFLALSGLSTLTIYIFLFIMI